MVNGRRRESPGPLLWRCALRSIMCGSAGIAASLVLLPLVAGCVCVGERVELTEVVTETESVALGEAETVDVTLDMSVGKLVLDGGADGLMDASFSYNVAQWRPRVEYSVVGSRGVLRITQPDAKGKTVPSGAENTWTLALAENVPLSLSLDMGVGQADLKLADIALTDLNVDHGVGALVIDLTGDRTDDLDVDIDGGVGEAILRVPEGVGVRVDGDMGIGSFRARGLTKRDGVFVNDAYGSTDATIDIRIDAGIGSIEIEVGRGGLASI